MTTISSSYGLAALSLLQNSSSSSSGLFSAIGGTATASKAAQTDSTIFNAIVPGSTSTSLSALITQSKVTTETNNIYSNVASRLTGMQNGTYTASSDWEKVASYAMQSGQPLTISLDSKGQVQALPQSESDLTKKYNTAQQKLLTQAMSDISTMAGKIQGNAKNDTWVKDLAGAEVDLADVHAGTLTAQSQWEITGSSLMTDHHPFKISLDSNGNLQVQDQTTASMDNLNVVQQKLLRAAVESVPSMIANGTPSTAWQATAESYDQAGLPYYLDIDPVTNQISAKENSAQNITSDFLKTEPYPDVGDSTPLLKQAETYIKNKQAYYLDFDSTGKIVAKPLTAANLESYNKTTSSSTTSTSTAGSIVSLLA